MSKLLPSRPDPTPSPPPFPQGPQISEPNRTGHQPGEEGWSGLGRAPAADILFNLLRPMEDEAGIEGGGMKRRREPINHFSVNLRLPFDASEMFVWAAMGLKFPPPVRIPCGWPYCTQFSPIHSVFLRHLL